jgi:hypothetical protein
MVTRLQCLLPKVTSLITLTAKQRDACLALGCCPNHLTFEWVQQAARATISRNKVLEIDISNQLLEKKLQLVGFLSHLHFTEMFFDRLSKLNHLWTCDLQPLFCFIEGVKSEFYRCLFSSADSLVRITEPCYRVCRQACFLPVVAFCNYLMANDKKEPFALQTMKIPALPKARDGISVSHLRTRVKILGPAFDPGVFHKTATHTLQLFQSLLSAPRHQAELKNFTDNNLAEYTPTISVIEPGRKYCESVVIVVVNALIKGVKLEQLQHTQTTNPLTAHFSSVLNGVSSQYRADIKHQLVPPQANPAVKFLWNRQKNYLKIDGLDINLPIGSKRPLPGNIDKGTAKKLRISSKNSVLGTVEKVRPIPPRPIIQPVPEKISKEDRSVLAVPPIAKPPN